MTSNITLLPDEESLKNSRSEVERMQGECRKQKTWPGRRRKANTHCAGTSRQGSIHLHHSQIPQQMAN